MRMTQSDHRDGDWKGPLRRFSSDPEAVTLRSLPIVHLLNMAQKPVRLCLMPANERPLYLVKSWEMMLKEM